MSLPVQDQGSPDSPWLVLVADDEPEVHKVTHLVLDDFRFDGRGLKLLDAENSDRAYELLHQHPDVAVLLLDVVMESEQAGLQLVGRIRKELGNQFVRIVLRTGQPGQAPEREVVADYDINDYKEKTELTADKLTTTMYAALRAYRDMRTIEVQRLGLENVIRASGQVFSHQDPHEFPATMLSQFNRLLGNEAQAICCSVDEDDGPSGEKRFTVIDGNGSYRDSVGQRASAILPPTALAAMHEVCRDRTHLYDREMCIFHLTAPGAERLLFVVFKKNMTELEHQLLWLFSHNASIAWDNLNLHDELLDSQLEMVYLLASSAETRSSESANHVHRVGLLAEMLANHLGLDSTFSSHLRHAAPLHDIGKIGIPDPILNKPGAHTDEEARVMRQHAEIGKQILSESKRPILQLAAEVASSHHENWDGSGYPNGLSGTDIPISGRITMVADVFDALGSKRCYKDPWDEDRIRNFMREQSGRKFEPAIVDGLLALWDQAMALRSRLPD